jgi:hypothetical protein
MAPPFVHGGMPSLDYCHNTLGWHFQYKIPTPTFLCWKDMHVPNPAKALWYRPFTHNGITTRCWPSQVRVWVWQKAICVRMASTKQSLYYYRPGHLGKSSLLYLHLFFTSRLDALGKPPFLPRRPNRQCLLILQASVRYASKNTSHFPIKETLNYRRSSPVYIHI